MRVPSTAVAAAREALRAIAPVEAPATDDATDDAGGDAGDDAGDRWLAVHVEPSRASEVNQRLAGAGIFASGLESGTDLELLFLELTGGDAAASHEGTFGSIGTPS